MPKNRTRKNGRCSRCSKKTLVGITPFSNGRYLCDSCTRRSYEILNAFCNGCNEEEIKARFFDIFIGDYIPHNNCVIVALDGSIFSSVTRNVNALYASLRSLNESEAI